MANKSKRASAKYDADVARKRRIDEGDCILCSIETTAAAMSRKRAFKAKAAHTAGRGYRTPTVSGSSKRAGSKARSVGKDRKEGGFVASTEAYARLLSLLNS